MTAAPTRRTDARESLRILYMFLMGFIMVWYVYYILTYHTKHATPMLIHVVRVASAFLAIYLGQLWKEKAFRILAAFWLLLLLRVLIPHASLVDRTLIRTWLFGFWLFTACFGLARVLPEKDLKRFLLFCAVVWLAGILVYSVNGVTAAWTNRSIRSFGGNAKYKIRMSRRLQLLFGLNVGASLLSISAMAALVLFFCARKKWLRLLVFLALLVILLPLCLTGSRTAIITFAFAQGGMAGILAMRRFGKNRKTAVRWSIGIAVLLVVTALTLLVLTQVVPLFNQAKALKARGGLLIPRAYAAGTKTSKPRKVITMKVWEVSGLSGREKVWTSVLEYLKENPHLLLTGTSLINPMAGPNQLGISSSLQPHAHNTLLQVLLVSGIPGLLLVLAFIGIVAVRGFRLMNRTGTPLWLSIVPMLVFAFWAGEMVDCFLVTYRYWMPMQAPVYICMGILSACGAKDRLSLQEAPAPREVPSSEGPLVSVVVPIMNVEDYLRIALDSLKHQTLENMEFILLNDGSTDHSLEIMEEYAKADSRFIVVDKPNSGYGHTMNVGLDMARGEYVGILEPDDLVAPNMFRRLWEEASAHQLDFVKSDFIQFSMSPDGTLRKKPVRLSPDDSFYNRTLTPGKEKATFFFPINTWTGLYRRDFLNKHNIRHHETPGASYQDNGFWFQTFCLGTRVRFIRDQLYMYRVDNPNASMRSRKKELCITEEYRWIHRWLEMDPDLLRQFEPVMYNKQLMSMLLTYSRLEASRKLPYLRHMRGELSVPYEKKLFDRSFLHPLDWKRLDRIMADPEACVRTVDVSVIIPVYNAEAYIEQCIQSVLFPCIVSAEVICVDDGSTDGTLEILRRLAEQDSRVRVYSIPHGGAGAARNAGMQYASGEFLAFLDADDFFEPNVLDLAWNKAQVENLDVVVFPSDNLYTDTGSFGDLQGCRTELLPGKRPFSAKDVRQDFFRLFVGWTWDKLFRASFVRETGITFAELPSSNDLSFTFSVTAAASRIDWLGGLPLAHHRLYPGSVSAGRDKTWDAFYHALLALREDLEKLGLLKRFERDYINYCLYFSLWQMTTVSAEAGSKIWRSLTDKWFDDLGVTGRPKRYFYHPDHYEIMEQMRQQSPEDGLSRVCLLMSETPAPPRVNEEPSSLFRRIRKKAGTGLWLLRRQGLKTVWRYARQKFGVLFRRPE